MGTKRLSALPPRYGDPFYIDRGRGRGRGRGRRDWLNERPFEKNQMEGLEEDSPMGMEEELEENYIKQYLKETKEIDKRKNGLYQQVLEEVIIVQ